MQPLFSTGARSTRHARRTDCSWGSRPRGVLREEQLHGRVVQHWPEVRAQVDLQHIQDLNIQVKEVPNVYRTEETAFQTIARLDKEVTNIKKAMVRAASVGRGRCLHAPNMSCMLTPILACVPDANGGDHRNSSGKGEREECRGHH